MSTLGDTVDRMGKVIMADTRYKKNLTEGRPQCNRAAACILNWYLGAIDMPEDYINRFTDATRQARR